MVPISRHPAAFEMARRTDRVRRVLDDLQMMAARDREQAVHVAGVTGEVHRQNRAHAAMLAAFERLLDPRRVEVEGARIDIDEYRPCPEVTDHFGRGREREGRGYNLVAGPDAKREQREMQRARAVRDRQRVTRADVGGEFFLEALGLGAGGDPSRAQAVEHLALLGGTDRGAMKRDLSHRVSCEV